MSEQLDYTAPIGQPTPGGRYEEMVPANPVPKETFGDETFSGDRTGLDKAADELVGRREPTREELQAKEPLERQYQHASGEHAGERMPVQQAVSPEQAAHDLTTTRDAEKAQELEAVEALLRNQVDGDRGTQTTEALGVEQQPQPQYEQPIAQPVEQQQYGVDPEVAQLIESNPKLQQAIRAEIQQRDAVAFQWQQQAVQAIEAAGQVAVANVLANFPELANVPVNQLGTALQVMQANNPERAQAARSHLEHVQRMAAAVEQNKQQQVAAQQAAFRQFADQSDKAFEKWAAATLPGREADLSKAAVNLLSDLGWSGESVLHEWNSNPLFRSAQGQIILALAAQQWQLRKEIPRKIARPVPTVQRPGTGSEFIERSAFSGQREALAKLERTGSPKDAAAYLVAKRAAARRG